VTVTMSQAETHNQPSVEELLVSIRQAIHGDGAGRLKNKTAAANKTLSSTANNGVAVSGSMSQTRVSLKSVNGQRQGASQQHSENFLKLRDQLHELGAAAPHAPEPKPARPRPVSRSRATSTRSGANGFAGILSGDARLEEALEKLKRAGLGDNTDRYQPEEPEPAEFRQSDIETGEPEYSDFEDEYQETPAEYIQEYDDQPDATDYQEPDHFSSQTRQAYLEPEPEPEPVEETYYSEPEPVTAPVASQPVPAPEPQPVIAPLPNPPVRQPVEGLTSEQSAAETSAAFNRLADTIVGHASSGERSIDELTRELLRPMLQSWLDENLPRLVERLVREEIERVARWGGK